MTVRFYAFSSAFLVFTELAGLPAPGSAEPLGPVSRCGELPPFRSSSTTRGDYAPGLDEGPVGRPGVLPSNLEVAPGFSTVSSTECGSHRRPSGGQGRRLAAGARLRVSVLVEDRPSRALSFNARTVLRHQDGSLVSAQVYLNPSPDAAELIAHELEHVLEQVDGVDLQAQAGNGVVWKSGDGAFETRRAIEAGRRVAREIRDGF